MNRVRFAHHLRNVWLEVSVEPCLRPARRAVSRRLRAIAGARRGRGPCPGGSAAGRGQVLEDADGAVAASRCCGRCPPERSNPSCGIGSNL